jgi:hypothetical protein
MMAILDAQDDLLEKVESLGRFEKALLHQIIE